MRLLVLGGTRFLSRAVAAVAVDRGHAVTGACRGVSGALPDGVTHLPWDRSDPPPAELLAGDWDAVVDVSRTPSHVRSAVAALPDAHWVFVSSINAYPDTGTPGTPATLALHEPLLEDVDPESSPEAYGRMKVACEQLVSAGAASATVVRPGLIVGPEDASGRFTYWPWRLARGGEVLAPGSPSDTVQVIDVRDLAAWLVTCAEQRTEGAYDGVGPVQPISTLLAACASGVSAEVSFTWVPQEFLLDQGVAPWTGARSVPLWLPRPEYDGMLAHDPAPSLAAGLTLRGLEETAADTLAWLRRTPDAARTGLTLDEETDLLAAWHAHPA